MKKGAFFCVMLLPLLVAARRVALPRRANNTVYITNAATIMQAGDTVELEGTYLWIKIFEIAGTAEAPIVFVNRGLVTIGGFVSYTCVLNGSHFKLLGNGDASLPYGIRLGVEKDSVYGAFGLALGDSKNVEVAFCEFQYLSCGILQNPTAGQVMVDCFYHHNYLHHLDNPKAAGRSEAFYLGNTKAATTTFKDCRIENNIIENTSGDGIQASLGTFIIANNRIIKYAQKSLAQQRAGIIIGARASATILNNYIEGGNGVALQVFGWGEMEIAGNSFENILVDHLPKEDIVYINGKTATPENPLRVAFRDNTFINVKPNRSIIYNGTQLQKNGGISYKQNTGVDSSQITLSRNDRWQ